MIVINKETDLCLLFSGTKITDFSFIPMKVIHWNRFMCMFVKVSL
ncbi:Uncharacterized protein dnl_49210 [Desulfonema limicola]|uniref:Uncharacterized protein n=1 Tax=Desulfonema limicola TaxID=45656 RepID=A0A975GIN5_9BACT|nr:Uncharacterized protein dnl_49210 [Desulfonema limicola]